MLDRLSDGVSQLEEVEHEVLEDEDELCDEDSIKLVKLEDDEEAILLVDGLGMYRSPHAASSIAVAGSWKSEYMSRFKIGHILLSEASVGSSAAVSNAVTASDRSAIASSALS